MNLSPSVCWGGGVTPFGAGRSVYVVMCLRVGGGSYVGVCGGRCLCVCVFACVCIRTS